MLIDARLRHECGWTDARILNISPRGLMVRAARAPRPGTYVEICRGTARIVARVVWADGGQFGARSQDMIAVDSLARGEESSVAPTTVRASDRRLSRREPSTGERAERGRRWSRKLEFVAITAFGCAAAFLVFDKVLQILRKPLAMVGAQLGSG